MSANIVSYKDYMAGWLDSTVDEFVKVLSPRAASTRYALITCLDSNPNPASLLDKSPELRPFKGQASVLGTSVLLPTRRLLQDEARHRVFFGFDEVWFFPTRVIRPKPPSLSLVGPSRLNQARLKKLGKWMSDNACSLALGGGEGLNFVVRAQGIVKLLLGYSIDQPEHSRVSA